MAALNRRRAIAFGVLLLVAAEATTLLPCFALAQSGLDVSGLDYLPAREEKRTAEPVVAGEKEPDNVVDLEEEKVRRNVEEAKKLLKNVEGAEAHKPALWGTNETEMIRSAERLRRVRDGLVGSGAILTAGSGTLFLESALRASNFMPFAKVSAALLLASAPLWIAAAVVASKRRSKLKSVRLAEALKSERIKGREAFVASSDPGP